MVETVYFNRLEVNNCNVKNSSERDGTSNINVIKNMYVTVNCNFPDCNLLAYDIIHRYNSNLCTNCVNRCEESFVTASDSSYIRNFTTPIISWCCTL